MHNAIIFTTLISLIMNTLAPLSNEPSRSFMLESVRYESAATGTTLTTDGTGQASATGDQQTVTPAPSQAGAQVPAPEGTPQDTPTDTPQSIPVATPLPNGLMPGDEPPPEESAEPGTAEAQVQNQVGQNGTADGMGSVQTAGESDIRSVTLSFAGDCTIGDDDKYSWNNFDSIYKKVDDPGYFFQGVKDIFSKDDFTFVNFEGTLTKATKKALKEYRFKGDPAYINVLKQGSIEGVTLANNHSMDYLDQGFKDTVEVLNEAGIPWAYFEKSFIVDIKGIKIGFLGYKGWEYESKSDKLLKTQVKAMREQGVSFIIANYHWGDQMSYIPNALQKRMAHFAIDNGVDLVIGHHPHVLQGREIYKGKTILYSLGNFCFGGAPNPSDKDTVIYQVTLSFDANINKIIKAEDRIIPARVSSEAGRNDYRPIIANGEISKRISEKFDKLSKMIK